MVRLSLPIGLSALAPRFVNNDYATAEVTYSIVHAPSPGKALEGCVWLCCVMYVCCCGCRVSQERINVSAVPMDPRIFFQPLSSRLAYHGFSEQCEQ